MMLHQQRNVLWVAVVLCLGGFVNSCEKHTATPPTAEVIPMVNTYHGVDIVDNYQWMENGNDSRVQAWDQGQNEYTRSILEAIPCREQIERELRQLYNKSSDQYSSFAFVEGKLYAKKTQPPKEQALLVRLDSPNDRSNEKVIVDPNTLDSTGKTSIDFFVVSSDGKLVAVSMSQGGTEVGHVSVFRVEDGQRLSDYVPFVNGPTAGGDVAWAADNSGIFYTHYPREGERPAEDLRFYQQVYWHQLGTATDQDKYIIGEEFPRIAEIEFQTSPDGSQIMAIVSNGDGGEYDHWLRRPSGEWTQVTRLEDAVTTARFGHDNSLYLLSTMNADLGKVLWLAAGETNLEKAEVVVDEGDAVIREFLPTEDKLYVVEMVGGPMRLRVLDLEGTLQKSVPIADVSSVSSLTTLGGNRVMYRNVSYLEPGAWYAYDAVEGKPAITRFAETSPADFSNIEAIREVATSKDGTQIPMTILRQKGTRLDGANPTVLYGYGGYGSSQTPGFDETLNPWLKHGGVYVIANIRGGGEFGEKWHKQGYLTQKQNVFDDFAACAQHLIDAGYTTSERLAIRGGSNGGLLVGATMVQNPGLFKAVVCQKGVLDMLRVELHPNGEFNTTEYGTVTRKDQFDALNAYSPYANVKEGVDYPDVLFTADVNDGRVDAYNSRKMAARIQAVDQVEGQTLLRMSIGGGHGIGMARSERISQDADIWAFLFDRLGVKCN